METNVLLEKVEMLPASLKKEVEDFIDFLIYKRENQKEGLSEKLMPDQNLRIPHPTFGSGKGIFGKMSDDFDEPVSEKPKLKRESGGLKGFVTYMADDFDAPLEDFKEYM